MFPTRPYLGPVSEWPTIRTKGPPRFPEGPFERSPWIGSACFNLISRTLGYFTASVTPDWLLSPPAKK